MSHPSEETSQMTDIDGNRTSAPLSVDVAILAILPESYEAVCQIFSLSEHEKRKGYQWTWGSVNLRDGGSAFIVTGLPLDRENVAAATFVAAMLEAWCPRNLLLVDIGGAVKGRDSVKLGDVVTHTVLHYYDYYKVGEADEESPRYLPLAGSSTRLRELSRQPAQRGDNSWIEKILVKRPGAGNPKVLPGEMLVGGSIQSNSSRLQHLLKIYPKALAVEMEGVGVSRAVLDRSIEGNAPEFLIIRGMSDYCNTSQSNNQKTRDSWRQYAATAAAAHAYALVREMAALPENNANELPPQRFTPPKKPINNLWESTRHVLRGRGQELHDLKARFVHKEKKTGIQVRHPHVIWGEAGVGKSALAREIAEELASQYLILWWIDASSQLKIRSGLRELSRRLGIPSASMDLSAGGHDEVETHRFMSDLREFIELAIPDGHTLIILDNVDDANLKHELEKTTLRYLPPSRCDVLITSQSSQWTPIAPTNTSLKGLDLATSTALIADESNRPELIQNEDVEAICRYFAGRPLFLKQIASLLRDGDDPSEFWNRLNKSAEDALDVLPEIEGFDPLWRRTYTLSIDRADSARPGSRNLLEAIAFFSPESIPLNLLHAMANVQQGWKSSHIDAALRTLTERSLLDCQRQRDDGDRAYTLHRVISALVRTMVRERGDAVDVLSVASSAIIQTIPNRNIIRRPERQKLMSFLAPHIESITDYVLEYKGYNGPLPILESAAEASSMLGLYRRTLSEWDASVESNQKAVELSSELTKPGNAALRKIRLANVVRQRAQFDLAQNLLNDALPELKEHGDGHDYAWALAVQARIFRHRPDSSPIEALKLLKEAMCLLKKFDNKEDPNLLRQLSELHGYISVVSRQLSDFDVAESESIEGLRVITGGMSPDEVLNANNLPDEPLLATHLRALGGVWRLRDDIWRAMNAHKRALEIFERVYGLHHIDVCRALDSLGRVQREWGDLNGALESFTRASEISDLQFGPKSPHAGTAAVNRALVYLELGDSPKALLEAEKGLGIYRFAYNEKHSDHASSNLRNESTAWALFVRANALANLGNLQQAYDDHITVLNWRQAHYPAVHALIASSHYALGDVLWKLNYSDSRNDVLSHHRQAMAMREQVFGTRPNYWLAQSQVRLGSLTNDRALLKLAYDTYSSQLKPGHWRTCEVETLIEALDT
jgi:nucleoside phosphorylase